MPRGSLACQKCGIRVPATPLTNTNRPSISCPSCGYEFDILGAKVLMSSACEILLTDSIYRVYWYHATDKKNWLDTVQKNEVMVHIGTKPSARTMAKWNQREHIYVVTVDPAAQVENALVEDTNDWDDYHKELRNIRYLNRWESPGQVSLLVEAKHLSLVRVDTSGFGR